MRIRRPRMVARRSPRRLRRAVLVLAVLGSVVVARPSAAQDYQSIAKGSAAPPNNGIIPSGTPGNSDDGICNVGPGVVQPDDVLRIVAGQSEPRMRAIRASVAGTGTIESTPAGDDVVTAVICPGPDS